MSEAASGALETLIHDVNSKCSSLKGAAALLRTASPEEGREMLGLMGQQAESLAKVIADFQKAASRK